jgi:hypothetical protein
MKYFFLEDEYRGWWVRIIWAHYPRGPRYFSSFSIDTRTTRLSVESREWTREAGRASPGGQRSIFLLPAGCTAKGFPIAPPWPAAPTATYALFIHVTTISGLAVRQSLLQERRWPALTKGGSSDWSTRCEMERQPRWRWLVGTISAVRRLLSERLLHAQWGASDKQSISRCQRWEMYGFSVCLHPWSTNSAGAVRRY